MSKKDTDEPKAATLNNLTTPPDLIVPQVAVYLGQATTNVMTLDDVANYLQISKGKAYQMAKSGRLPGGQIGNRWRFIREEIEQWARNNLK